MSDKEKENSISKNFTFAILIFVVIGSVNIIYPLVIGLIYTAETMGQFSILFYWVSLLSIPIQNGIAPSILRFLATKTNNTEKDFNKIGSKITLFYLILVLLVFPAISLTVLDFSILELVFVIIILAFSVYHYLFRNSFQGQEKFNLLVKIEFISFGIFIVFMIFFAIFPFVFNWTSMTSYYLFFIPIIAFHVVFNIIAIVVGKPIGDKLNVKEFFKFPAITKNILQYAGIIGLGSLLGVGVNRAQIIISDLYLADFEVGVLGFWNYATAPFLLLTITLTAVLVPRITNIQTYNKEATNPFINSLNWGISLILMPIFGLILILISSFPEVIDVLTFSKYDVITYWLVIIFALFQSSSRFISAPLLAYFSSFERKVAFNLLSSVIYAVSIIISWIFLAPRYGIFGFAAGITIGGFISTIGSQIFALIVSKGKVGSHMILYLIYCSFTSGAIVLTQMWSELYTILIWTFISIPGITFGIIRLVKLLKTEEYSIRYIQESNKLIKSDELIGNKNVNSAEDSANIDI